MFCLKFLKSSFFHLAALSSIVISSPVSANNSWPDNVLDHIDNYHHPLEDGFVSTVNGQCRGPNVYYWQMVTKVKNYRVRSSYMASKELPIKVALQRDANGNVIKAPLMYIVPGAFNNLNGRMPRQLTDAFTKLGYHTVTFPNPWGTQYIEEKPLYPTGSVVQEGESLYEAMRFVHEAFEEQDILDGKVKMYGVSYGGFLSVMINALDAEHERPIINGEVTSVSPPYHLAHTLERLDELISETQPFIGIGLFNTVRKGLGLCFLSDNGSVDDQNIKNAKGLTISSGFHSNLISSLMAYDKAWNIRSVPHARWGSYSPVFRRWMKAMSFTKYYETYNPQGLQSVRSDEGDLYAWMNRAQVAGNNLARVIVSQDDFLNDTGVEPFDVRHEETIILPNGGHYGFRSLGWYRQFQKKALFKGTRR